MRTLFVLVVLCLSLFAATANAAPKGTGLTVFVVNESTAVSDQQLADALPVMQSAVSHEFAQAWGVDATLYQVAAAPAGSWQIDVQDDSTLNGAMGYHDIVNGSPIAYVFAATSESFNTPWPEVFTHELFEMLADPWLDRLSLSTRLWLVEVCDPVETAFYPRLSPSGVTIDISDFATPAWYRKSGKGPYDYLNLTTHRAQLLSGGYVSYWTSQGWQQLFGRKVVVRP